MDPSCFSKDRRTLLTLALTGAAGLYAKDETILGPFLGHIGLDSAILWARTPRAGTYRKAFLEYHGNPSAVPWKSS